MLDALTTRLRNLANGFREDGTDRRTGGASKGPSSYEEELQLGTRLDELATLGTSAGADAVGFDPIGTSLESDTVGEALRELANGAGEEGPVAAASVTYDHAASGLNGDTAQEAIDEVADAIADEASTRASADTTIAGSVTSLIADLASTALSKGASLIGFRNTGTGLAAATVQAAIAEIKALLVNAAVGVTGFLTSGDFQKLATYEHGTPVFEADVEVGTYDADVTTGSNREVRARLWSNTNDGEGRYFIRPLPGRTSGNVIFRIWNTLGVSGSAGNKVAWKWSGDSIGIGDTLAANLPNAQTVYQDVAAQTAHVMTSFDITVSAAIFNQAKRFAFRLERLASSDAQDNYTAGTYYSHAIEVIYTGYGQTAAPSVPT